MKFNVTVVWAHVLILSALLLNATGMMAQSISPVGVPHLRAGYKLVWQDEFDGTKIDFTKWDYRGDFTKRQYACVEGAKTIALDGNGHLVIQVVKEKGNYYVGQLSTHNHFNPTYGYFECRAKMNRGIGPHIAFWLQSPAISKLPINHTAVNGSEIDIFEYHRKAPHTVWQTIHINGYGEDHKSDGKEIEVRDIDTGFHTFGLLWTRNSYTFYVDGIETRKTSFGISNRPEFIILSTELTGFGGDPALGQYPDSVVFDYVRVYQLK